MDRPVACFRPCLLLLAIVLASAGAFTMRIATADAAVFCVGTAGDPICATTGTDLQESLDAARNNPGADMVRIYPGSYTGNFSYQDNGDDNRVEIKGVGDAAGVNLVMASTNGMQAGLRLDATAGSTVENLTVTIPANADGSGDSGIVLGEGSLADEVRVVGPDASNATGITCHRCEITDTVVDLRGDDGPLNTAVLGATGDLLLADSNLTSDRVVVQNDPEGTASVLRSRLRGWVGALTDSASLVLKDSLIEIDSNQGAGVLLANGNTGVFKMEATLEGMTVVAKPGVTDARGILASADDGEEAVEVNLASTLITRLDTPLALYAGGNQTVKIQSRHSAYDDSKTLAVTTDNGQIESSPGAGHTDLDTDPGFTDPASGDFTPTSGSPLLDAGDPADPPAGSTDINGNPRACQSLGTGVIRRDIGAFERRSQPTDDCGYPETSIAAGPEAYPPAMHASHIAEFKLASTKAGSTFSCSIDDAPFTPCGSTYTTPELAQGPHTFRARARDAFGNVDQTPVERVVYLGEEKDEPPSCETVPALCPDRKAPKVTGLKAPKKTKLARVKVRFGSNEQGVTFTCRLNSTKARKCKSPWLTPKLRKGRNRLRIQATDKAGNRSRVVTRVINRVVKRKTRQR